MSQTEFPHIPVLLAEVLQALQPQSGKTYVDATLGAGGHAAFILEHSQPDGRLMGLEQDPAALQLASDRLATFGECFTPIRGNFAQIASLLPVECLPITGGILADIGVSSMQLDQGERGFSFMKTAPLDMRMNPEGTMTAETVVNTYPEAELVRIFSAYGEEHLSKTIARAIIARRDVQPFHETTDLAAFIAELYKQRGKHEKIHPATRVFQALRIEVNQELESLKQFLEAAPALLAPGAVLAVISFHSLEDRVVKAFLKEKTQDCICPPRYPVCQCDHRAQFKLPKGQPFVATAEEIRRNPRSRSAKLRVAIRV